MTTTSMREGISAYFMVFTHMIVDSRCLEKQVVRGLVLRRRSMTSAEHARHALEVLMAQAEGFPHYKIWTVASIQ